MEKRPRLSIPTRIFLGVALVLAAFAVVSVTGLVQHDRTTKTLLLLHHGYIPLTLSIGQAHTDQQRFVESLEQFEEHDRATRSWLGMARRIRPGSVRRALEELGRAEELDPPPEDRALIASVRETLERVLRAYVAGDADYNELYSRIGDDPSQTDSKLLDQLKTRERHILASLRKSRQRMQERIKTTSSRSAAEQQRAAILLAVLTLLAIAVGVAVTWWTQRVLKPLPLLHERVQAVARGDLSRRLEARSDDELGRLTSEFERMVETLATRDARLREAAEAQRQLQEMQKQIVTGLRAAIVVVDGAGVVRTVNPAARAVLGLDETHVGESLESTGLLSRLPELGSAVRDVGAGRTAPAVIDAAEIEGTGRSVNVRVTPFGAARDAVLVVAEDVTEELATKARLIHSERLAAIGKMAAHVTHEVRNPLSSIGLNVEMLEDEMGDRGVEAQALLGAIQREIDRLTDITEEYLGLARVPEPRLELEDLGDLVRSTADFVRREAAAAGVAIDTVIEDGLAGVRIDEQQIRQALLNLLRNAREAMPDGGRITVRVRSAGDGVALSVEDQGPGIDPAARERLFDLFYTTKERGTGLGLPLTQQIVVAHGGSVRCAALLGGGTTFELWLPLGRPSEVGGRPSVRQRVDVSDPASEPHGVLGDGE